MYDLKWLRNPIRIIPLESLDQPYPTTDGGINGDPLFSASPKKILNQRIPSGWWFRLFCIAVASIATYICLHDYSDTAGFGLPLSNDINTLCQDRCQADSSSICNLPQGTQFKKFIWFLTDGYPYALAEKSLKHYENNSVPFLVEVYGTKWSHTIYTSWFTGMSATNLFGEPIVGDNLLASMHRAKACNDSESLYKLKYIGPEWAPLTLLGGAEGVKEKYGMESELVEEHASDPVGYPTVPLDRLSTLLQEAADTGKSMLFHSGTFDKATHVLTEKQYSVVGNYLEEYFSHPTLKDFIDSHPDYLLIFSSDHGASVNRTFHGDQRPGKHNNIGFFNFYNPALQGRHWESIQVVDVLPTLSMYLEGVDIPFHSLGIAQNQFAPDVNTEAKLKIAKRNLLQLADAAAFRRIKIDRSHIDTVVASSSDLALIQMEVEQMKQLVYQPSMPKHIPEQIFFACVSIALYAIWYRIVNASNHRTWLLLLPLLFVFAFSWRNFQRIFLTNGSYSAILGLALVALNVVFSPAKLYILLANEGLNVIDYVLHLGIYRLPLGMDLYLGIIGTVFSMVEGYFFAKNFNKPIWVVTHLHLLLFFATRRVESLYFVAGFQVFCFTLYLSLLGIGVYFVAKRQYYQLTLPLTVILLLFRSGDISLVFLNFQFHRILPELMKTKRNPTEISLQCSTLYVTNHIVWFFHLCMGEGLNLGINPLNGLVGVLSWNLYPSYSGFLMAYTKYGIFVLSFFLVAMVIKNRVPLITLTLQTCLGAMATHLVIAVFDAEHHQVEAVIGLTVIYALHLIAFAILNYLDTARPKVAKE